MARIRTIKPEFFTSADIVSLSPLARLLYIALWCEADKEGRLVWRPATFKLRYLPGDDCDANALCDEIVKAGLVVPYGDGLAHIPTFWRHQHVNPRESTSTLQAPDGVKDTGPRRVGKNMREYIFERDGGKCVRCGSSDKVQVDHILPQSCGGPHIEENLRLLCRHCNAGRPVSGEALDRDLERDGLSVKYLRSKFGIDASIQELTDREEGKGREGKEKPPKPPAQPSASLHRFHPGFETLWAEYPRKVGKDAAARAFAKRRPDEALLRAMVDAVKAQRGSPQWAKDAGQFIPHLATWLNEGRWQDEAGPITVGGDVFAGAV